MAAQNLDSCDHHIPVFLLDGEYGFSGPRTLFVDENQRADAEIAYYISVPCSCGDKKKVMCPFDGALLPYPKALDAYLDDFIDSDEFSCCYCGFAGSNLSKTGKYLHAISHFDTTGFLSAELLSSHGVSAGNVLVSSVKPPFSFQIHQMLREEFPETHTNIDDDDDDGPIIPSADDDQYDEELAGDHAMDIEQEPHLDHIDSLEIEEEPNSDLISVSDLASVNHPNSLLSAVYHQNPKWIGFNQEIPVFESWSGDCARYMPSQKYLRFVQAHYLKFSASKAHINYILAELHSVLDDNLALLCDYPSNYDDISARLKFLPVLPIKNCSYHLPQLLQRTLSAKPDLVSKMNFFPEIAEKMSEFHHTPRFNELYGFCNVGEVPLCLLLYQDGFREFRSVFGSAIGVYCSVLNAPKLENAKLSNVFCIGLAKSNFDAYRVLSDVRKQLKETPVIDIKCANGEFIKARIFLAINSCDMPQRHFDCHMMLYNSNSIPCFRCCCTKDDLCTCHPISSYATRSMTDWKAKLDEFIDLQADHNRNKKRIGELFDEGVRLFASDKNGDDHIMNLTPLYRFEHFNPILETVPELFHVEFLGLIPLHLELFMDHVVDSPNLRFFEDLCMIQGFNVKNSKFWNGDQWLEFAMVSSFIFTDFCNHRKGFADHLENWEQHMHYVFILLKESLSHAEIDDCMVVCQAWRRDFIDLYGEKVACPNFHAILHTIDDCHRFGAPIGWWVRHFEHKHKYFRKIIDGSNHKHVEMYALRRDNYINTLNLMFPFNSFEFYAANNSYSVLNVGDFVTADVSGVERICKITNCFANEVEIDIFRAIVPGDQALDHKVVAGAINISKMVVETAGKVGWKFMKSRFQTVNGYLNPNGCLNYIKFKFPKYAEL